MPRRARASKSRIGVAGSGGPAFRVEAHIEGVEKTSAEFRAARRGFNAAMRDAIQRAGETAVLPAIKRTFGSRRFGGSLYVKRDRTTVFIASRLRGALNRAVGWFDFGGKRPRDRARRRGNYVIVRELHGRRERIDNEILRGVLSTFDPIEHSP